MTDLTTTHLKCLLEQATPGPWEYIPGEAIDERCIGNPGSMTMCIGVEANGAGSSCSDADLTLAAAAPQLAEEVIRLRKELRKIRIDLHETILCNGGTDIPVLQGITAQANETKKQIDQVLGDHQ